MFSVIMYLRLAPIIGIMFNNYMFQIFVISGSRAHVFAAVPTCSSQPDELGEPLPGPSSSQPDELGEPLPGPLSTASPEKIKLQKEVARLRTKVSRLKKKKTPSTKQGRKEARINNIVMQWGPVTFR